MKPEPTLAELIELHRLPGSVHRHNRLYQPLQDAGKWNSLLDVAAVADRLVFSRMPIGPGRQMLVRALDRLYEVLTGGE
jgi:hypothetical protein